MADYLIVAGRVNDIVDAAMLAIEQKIPYRVIGAGTGVLVGESGFPGLIILNQTSGCVRLGLSSQVVVESGVKLSQFVHLLASQALGGLEFMTLIPGTVGGAIASTATLDGRKVSSYVREICLFDSDRRKVATLPFSDAATLARTPLFSDGVIYPPILLSATFQMAQLSQEEILRRLKMAGKTDNSRPRGALAMPFIDSISQVPMEKAITRELKRMRMRYQPSEELLTFNPSQVRPAVVRRALELLRQQAARYGVETTPRITYLGYYQDKDDQP